MYSLITVKKTITDHGDSVKRHKRNGHEPLVGVGSGRTAGVRGQYHGYLR